MKRLSRLGAGLTTFVLVVLLVTDMGRTVPVILAFFFLMTLLFVCPLVYPAMLCVRLTDHALEIVRPFWIQRVAWADIDRFIAVDLEPDGAFSEIEEAVLPFPALIGYVLGAEAFEKWRPFGWRSNLKYGCHGMLWVPDGLSREGFLAELREYKAPKEMG